MTKKNCPRSVAKVPGGFYREKKEAGGLNIHQASKDCNPNAELQRCPTNLSLCLQLTTHIVTSQLIHAQHKCQLYDRIPGTTVCARMHPKHFNPCLDESGQLKVEHKSSGKEIKIV